MRSADQEAGDGAQQAGGQPVGAQQVGAQQIRATRSGDDVRVTVPLANGKLAIVELPFDKVRAAGMALLEVAHYYRDASASLFDAESTVMAVSPRMELRATATGEALIAIDTGFLGPLILKLDLDAARDLRDGLTMLFAGQPRS